MNVQNKVSTATGQLPSEVTQIGVTTMKRQTSMVKIFSLYSPDDTYDEGFLANYSKINIEPRIVRIPGVGEAFTLGADYSMRIWLKPDVMAQYRLMPSDITAVLAEQNLEASTGSLGENSKNAFQYTMKYTGRLTQPEEAAQAGEFLPDHRVYRRCAHHDVQKAPQARHRQDHGRLRRSDVRHDAHGKLRFRPGEFQGLYEHPDGV